MRRQRNGRAARPQRPRPMTRVRAPCNTGGRSLPPRKPSSRRRRARPVTSGRITDGSGRRDASPVGQWMEHRSSTGRDDEVGSHLARTQATVQMPNLMSPEEAKAQSSSRSEGSRWTPPDDNGRQHAREIEA
jgi:hypothetical protein